MLSSLSEITQLWDKALIKIEKQLNEKQLFDAFFAGSYINNVNDNTITVVVNSALAVRLISSRYSDIVVDIINELTGHLYQIEYVLSSDLKKEDKTILEPVSKKASYFTDAKVDQNLTFENFVVGEFNREASQAALFVAANPGKTFAQPLFIYANSGLGKTHLLHAIGNYVKKEGNINSNVLYISASDFVDEYIKFVKGEKEAESLKDFFDSVDILLLDDVQMIANKVQSQDMFFTIYNKMVEKNRQIVITSDKQPAELSGLEDRLITRFSKGLTVKIDKPDQTTCVEILKKKLAAEGITESRYDENILYFLADKFSKDVRELEGATNRLIWYYSSNTNERLTMEKAIEAVQPLAGAKSLMNQLNEQKIINVVADYYNLTPSQLTGKIRTGQIALARHVAMYLIRAMLDIPLKKVGDMFGGKDHTTVMNAIQKVDKGLKTDEGLKQAIGELKKRLKV